ncbi:MAG: hypothetical protein KF858_15585 [Candidatus Sumerlaeia bacterium]|nr:hypothetical protein [Candidatus Sumerlaeia bacterium]
MEGYLQFKRAARACLVCGTSLPELERHPTILTLSPLDEAVRQDLCPTCWDRLDQKEYFSYWITRRYQQGPSAEDRRLARSERNEALWALFNALYARTDRAEYASQLFLLAHLLMKYRLMAYKGVAADGRLTFFHGPTQETYLIDDLPLASVSFVDAMTSIDGQLTQYAPARDAAGPPGGDE